MYYANATYSFQAINNTSGSRRLLQAVNGSQFQCMLESYNQTGSVYMIVQPPAACTSPTVGTCRDNLLQPSIFALDV